MSRPMFKSSFDPSWSLNPSNILSINSSFKWAILVQNVPYTCNGLLFYTKWISKTRQSSTCSTTHYILYNPGMLRASCHTWRKHYRFHSFSVELEFWIPFLGGISEYLTELCSGFQSPGFRIPRAKCSRILDSTSKNFPDSRVRIHLHGEKY